MKHAEYAPQALALANRGRGFIFDLHHAALGLVTEAGELIDAHKREHVYAKPLDMVNIVEETGDVLWYLNLAAETMAMPLWQIQRDLEQYWREGVDEAGFEPLTIACGLSVACATALTSANAAFVHPSTLPYTASDFQVLVPEILEGLFYYCHLSGFTLEQAADANARKLNKRYPNGFNVTDAVNRDVVAERKILEGGGNNEGGAPATVVAVAPDHPPRGLMETWFAYEQRTGFSQAEVDPASIFVVGRGSGAVESSYRR